MKAMRYIKKITSLSTRFWLALAAVVAVFATGCVYLDSVDIEQTIDGKKCKYAIAGTEATFTMHGHIECQSNESNTQFVVAMLVPKSWKMGENAKVTYKCDLGDDRNQLFSMSEMPATTVAKNANGMTWKQALTAAYGVGHNVLEDMEWVVLVTDKSWDISNGDKPNYTVYITTNVGEDNLKFKPGFFVNHTNDGFSGGNDHKKVLLLNDCFEVVEGNGAVTDYCNNHYFKTAPLLALPDDFVTFSFLSGVNPNGLAGGDVYLEATAHTAGGLELKLDRKDATTLMKPTVAGSTTYEITVWPTGLFNVPDGDQIVRIDYFFTNSDRSVVIGQWEDDNMGMDPADDPLYRQTPFTYTFTCN